MGPQFTQVDLDRLEASLLNTSGSTPLAQRFRSLFTLKALAKENEEAIRIISRGFDTDSALLKHELAYCLGQTKNAVALPTLEKVLANEKEDPMVRHEAAEAMGAISATESLPVLRRYLDDPERAVRETCQIAVDKIEWDHSPEGQEHAKSVARQEAQAYTSVDPAPPTSSLLRGPASAVPTTQSVSELKAQLLDTSLPLFVRYRAMFALRNIGSDEAVDALSSGFDDDSALFKHEIAFIFGQLLSPHSVPALLKVLADAGQSDMVRHEAAEALGGIATPDVLPALKEWRAREDSPRVVRESCEVALDMWEYENSGEFQYANGLESAPAAAVTSA